MRMFLPALVLAVATAPLAALGDEPAPKGDLAKFQGAWSAKVGPEKNVKIVITIKGITATFAVTLPDGTDFESKGEIKIDESAKPFKTIDWRKFTGFDGDIVPENLGIYDFEGDDLKLCSGGPGNERPTEFKPGEGGPPNTVVLKREAK